MNFSPQELDALRFACVIARLQMKTNAAIMQSSELYGAQEHCLALEKEFAALAEKIYKATTQ